MSALAPTLQAFFTDRLVRQRQASPHTIAQRVARYLEGQGLLVRDPKNGYLTADAAYEENEQDINHLLGSSITSATAPALLYLLHPCSRTALP